jgi:hypothetical protein
MTPAPLQLGQARSLICIAHASLAVGLTPPLSNAAASETYVTGIPDWLTQLLQWDDTLPTLAADPDTIRDAIKAVGEDTQVTGERQQASRERQQQ